jgi:FixJ family two-component response regulator
MTQAGFPAWSKPSISPYVQGPIDRKPNLPYSPLVERRDECRTPLTMARIGVVDDDLSVRRAVGRLLRANGYTCVTYESAEVALADPALLRVNCIIIDIQLGGMNGFEFRDRLDSLGVRIPRLFITAHVGSDLPGRLGDSVLLIKPFEEGQLIASLQSLMGSCQF